MKNVRTPQRGFFFDSHCMVLTPNPVWHPCCIKFYFGAILYIQHYAAHKSGDIWHNYDE